jgi:hypothetical protein
MNFKNWSQSLRKSKIILNKPGDIKKRTSKNTDFTPTALESISLEKSN